MLEEKCLMNNNSIRPKKKIYKVLTYIIVQKMRNTWEKQDSPKNNPDF